MRGIRLHPNFHEYTLDDPRFARLLELATQRKLIVQLALSMQDERTQSPATRAPHVDAKPLPAIVKTLPDLKLVLINVFRSQSLLRVDAIASAGQVYFDIAMLEGTGGVSELIEKVTVDRVVFGTNFPLFYSDSSVLKLRESPLARFQHEAITRGNAMKLLG
jgi:predicted TIM-barrel fold metal-dependent hydrolase